MPRFGQHAISFPYTMRVLLSHNHERGDEEERAGDSGLCGTGGENLLLAGLCGWGGSSEPPPHHVQGVYRVRKKLGGLGEVGSPRVLLCAEEALPAFPLFPTTAPVKFRPRRGRRPGQRFPGR